MAAAVATQTAAIVTHKLTVEFTIDLTCDEHIQTVDGVRQETMVWLRSMGADIQRIDVRRAA